MDVTYLWNASPWTLHPHSLGFPGDFSYTCAVNNYLDDRFKKKKKNLKSYLCSFAFSANPEQMERNRSCEHPTGHHGGQEIVDPRHEEQGHVHGRHGVCQTWGVWSLVPPYPCSAFPSHWTVKAWKTPLAKNGSRQLHVRLWKEGSL